MAGSTALMAILLAGCSSVPDAANPVEWYRGATEMMTGRSASKEAREAAARKVEERDYPDNRIIPERPRVLSPEERKDIADGLVADRANAKYTQERINRDGNPTRPLAPKPAQTEAPAPAESSAKPAEASQPAAEAAPSPAPAAAEPPRTRLAPGGQHSEAQPAPSVPPQQVAYARAAEAVQPAPVAAPQPVAAPPSPQPAAVAAVPASQPAVAAQPVAARQPSAVDDAFRRRLAQSAPATTTTASTADTAVVTPASMATPRLTRVTVEFSPGTSRLSDRDAYDLEDLADAARRSGSRIRVVASAQATAQTAKSMSQALALAIRRADAVTIELRRNGVPADRIDISTGNDGDRVDAGLF